MALVTSLRGSVLLIGVAQSLRKKDDLLKGQLMMLCLSGQALAVAEQLEEEKNAQQKYSEVKV